MKDSSDTGMAQARDVLVAWLKTQRIFQRLRFDELWTLQLEIARATDAAWDESFVCARMKVQL